MENTKTALIERINESNNILVTVSTNPNVDQLAAAIGMTILLNKLGKHATAVFSGEIPSTIEFLKPEETIEDNTDSLRDFIIALDKSKADKLRYKVEDKQVKIFITPYHTSISEDDLIFSQGDFNVDLVLALGVHEQADLDHTITSHGRILHDAAVATINLKEAATLGTIDWVSPKASSLCEMLVEVAEKLKKDALDPQIATAFLTGIVAETKRFSNEKTTPTTMSVSARLMDAGANQQLVAAKLKEQPKPTAEEAPSEPAPQEPVESASSDGSLNIDHTEDIPPVHIDENGQLNIGQAPKAEETLAPKEELPVPQPEEEKPEPQQAPESKSETQAKPKKSHDGPKPKSNRKPGSNKMVTEPPTLGGTLSAAGSSSPHDSTPSPLNLPPVEMPILSRDSGPAKADDNVAESPASQPSSAVEPQDQPSAETPKQEVADDVTLQEIEKSVESHHLQQDEPKAGADEAAKKAEAIADDLESARKAVEAAAFAGPDNALPKPAASLGAIGEMKMNHKDDAKPAEPAPKPEENYFDVTKLDEAADTPAQPSAPIVTDATAPPPVPPPMTPLNFPKPE